MRNILARLCAIFGCTYSDKLDRTIKRAADLHGDLCAQQAKADWHGKALLLVDHNTDWNLFAALKEKQHEAEQEVIATERKAAAAKARVDELINQLKEPEHALSDAAVAADAFNFVVRDVAVEPAGNFRIVGCG